MCYRSVLYVYNSTVAHRDASAAWEVLWGNGGKLNNLWGKGRGAKLGEISRTSGPTLQ